MSARFLFSAAPAGLGHLRVMQALIDSRPPDFATQVLPTDDHLIRLFHRFTSVNPLAKSIYETFQYGSSAHLVTHLYRYGLLKTASRQQQAIIKILKGHKFNSLVFVSTHFGLSHQLESFKTQLAVRLNCPVFSVVVVTDATSQPIWCVPNADLTIVPSESAFLGLQAYAKQHHYQFKGLVLPYPLAPSLTKYLPAGQRSGDFKSGSEIRIAIPVSGAAVGLPFIVDFIRRLSALNSRFSFWLVCRQSSYTQTYLQQLASNSRVHLFTSSNEMELVRLYQQVYTGNCIHLELTRPSEQAFKALLKPSQVGGSIMLLTAPVGRQEHENLAFLAHHRLISTSPASSAPVSQYPPRAYNLPLTPNAAAVYTDQLLRSGLLTAITSASFAFSPRNLASGEISDQGSQLFWQHVSRFS